jgi:hypothetical protein
MGSQVVVYRPYSSAYLFYRRDPNPARPESQVKVVFVRQDQGYTVVRFPLTSPMPHAGRISFEGKFDNHLGLKNRYVDVPQGATEIQIPMFVPNVQRQLRLGADDN